MRLSWKQRGGNYDKVLGINDLVVDLECVYCSPKCRNFECVEVSIDKCVSSDTRNMRLTREFVILDSIVFAQHCCSVLHFPSMYLCNNLSFRRNIFFVMQQPFHVSEKVCSKCP